MNGIEWLPVGLGKLSISNIRPPATSRLRQRIDTLTFTELFFVYFLQGGYR